MGVIKKILQSNNVIKQKFDKKYPFEIKDQFSSYFKSFGAKNPDKRFFVIWRDWLGAGFFANLGVVFSYVRIAEELGMIPVIDFKNFKTLYNVDDKINGTRNAWEYYFKQISKYSLDEVYSSKNVFFCNGGLPRGFEIKKETKFKDLYKKYAKINPYIEKKIDKYSDFFKNNKVLGVHFRGGDMNHTQHHTYGPTLGQMFENTDKIIEKYKIDKIFIATEVKKYLDEFIKRYGKKVFYIDSYRSNKISPFNVNPRKNHRYLLGLEVLMDFVLLSKCEGILHSNSSVSFHAIEIGNHKFIYEIKNGVNSPNFYIANYSYNIKKFLPAKFGGLPGEVIVTEK